MHEVRPGMSGVGRVGVAALVLSAGLAVCVPAAASGALSGVVSGAATGVAVADEEGEIRLILEWARFEGLEPPRNAREWRSTLVELVAAETLSRRVVAAGDRGEGSLLSAHGRVSMQDGAIRAFAVEGDVAAKDWEEAMRVLGQTVQRARRHGVTSDEVNDAKAVVLERLRESLEEVDEPEAREDGALSAARRAEIAEPLLETISAAEANWSLRRVYEPTSLTGADGVTEDDPRIVPAMDELRIAADEALQAEVEPREDLIRPTRLMDRLPRAAEVVEAARDEASGVWSAWLENGVRLHVREVDDGSGRASVSILLAGGMLLEGEDTRGLSNAVAAAMNRPALERMNSTEVREFLSGRGVRVTATAHADTLRIRVEGDASSFNEAFQLVHLMLTEGVAERSAVDRWRSSELGRMRSEGRHPLGMMGRELVDVVYPEGETRSRPLTESQIERVDLEDVRSWWRELAAESPIEVAVVGDLPRTEAAELAATYLGTLPARDRISDEKYASLRELERGEGPFVRDRVLEQFDAQGAVVLGFIGPDSTDLERSRRMRVAADVLNRRLVQKLRGDDSLTYALSVRSSPAVEFPGFGLFMAAGPVEAGRFDDVVSLVESMFNEFRDEGPTDEELERSTRRLARAERERLEDKQQWLGLLQDMTYRGRSLEAVMFEPEALQSVTAEGVRRTFSAYYDNEAKRVRVLLRPSDVVQEEEPSEVEPAGPAPESGNDESATGHGGEGG